MTYFEVEVKYTDGQGNEVTVVEHVVGGDLDYAIAAAKPYGGKYRYRKVDDPQTGAAVQKEKWSDWTEVEEDENG